MENVCGCGGGGGGGYGKGNSKCTSLINTSDVDLKVLLDSTAGTNEHSSNM